MPALFLTKRSMFRPAPGDALGNVSDSLSFGPVLPAGSLAEFVEARRRFWIETTYGLSDRRPAPEEELQSASVMEWRAKSGLYSIEELPRLIEGAGQFVLSFGGDLDSQLAFLLCLNLIPDGLPVSVAANPERMENPEPLSAAEKAEGIGLWELFLGPSPKAFHERARQAGPRFAALRNALGTYGRRFPNSRNGLDGLWEALLGAASAIPSRPAGVIGTALGFEPVGDLLLYARLLADARSARPMLAFVRQPASWTISAANKEEIYLTPLGAAILAGRMDAVEVKGVNYWVGGCHLDSSRGPVIRWNTETHEFLEP